MNYFIIVFLIIFPVFSFAAKEEENNPPEIFILNQSKLDSGAVLGGAEPDSELVQRAEAGDVEAMVRLYEFYKQEGKASKANDYLSKAAEKGHIPSLKLVYQQTGGILLTGLEAAVSSQLFAPLRSPGGRTEFGLARFSYMDYLSSEQGLEESTSRIRNSIISQITNGEKDSLVEMGGKSDRALYSQPVRPVIMELAEDGTFREVERLGVEGEYISPSLMLVGFRDEKVYERFQAQYEQAGAEGRLGELLYIGESWLQKQPVHPLLMEPTEDGTLRPVHLKLGADGEYLFPPPKEGVVDERFQDFYKRLKAEGNLKNLGHFDISHLVEVDPLKMLGRYVAYHLENSETQMEYWLHQLKRVANTGDVLALQIVYRITGEVLMEGYTKAVSSTIDSLLAEDREKGVSPKMTAMQNRDSVSGSVMRQIKAPFVEGVEGLMFNLYEGYQAKGDAEGVANWLDQLEKGANEGRVPALRIVYHITGEVLAAGLNAAVSNTMNNLFAEGREQGVSPEITAMQNRERVRNNIMGQIKTPVSGNKCLGAFSK